MAFLKFTVAVAYLEFLARLMYGIKFPYRMQDRLNEVLKQTSWFKDDVKKFLNDSQFDELHNDAGIMDEFLNASVVAQQTGRNFEFQNDLNRIIAKYKS